MAYPPPGNQGAIKQCMPEVIISCINPVLRKVLSREAQTIPSPIDREEFQKMLRDLKDCPDGQLIGAQTPTGSGRSSRRSGAKREPTEYNKFVSSCLSNRPEGTKVTEQMKECARQWRNLKR